MDDAFGNLGDISDEQTLERLESLFESSGNFGSLESPILSDEVSSSNNGAGNLFAPLDSNAELFSGYGSGSSLPSSSVASAATTTTSSVSLTPAENNGSVSSSSSSSYTTNTQVTQLQAASPLKKSPSPAPAPPQQVLYATKSTVRTTPISQNQQSNLILTAPSAVFSAGSNPLMQSAGGTLQIQLNSLRNPKPQPQILPKPMAKPPHRQLTAVSSSILLNQQGAGGQILTTSVAPQNPPILINSLGQVTTAASHGGGTPFLIQQPAGNQVFVLRPSAPAATLPTASNTPAGTFLLQQPSSTVITAQPQVKIITPQGRMQMQQIQTPSGPKLIAVPVGQTLVQTSAGLISTAGNVLAAGINFPQTSLTTTASTVNSVAVSTPQPHLQQPLPSPIKKKKSKKRPKDGEILTQAGVPCKKPKVVDLGELMKDVGLDLDGFHEDQQQPGNASEEASKANTQMLTSGTIVEAAAAAPSAAPGSHLVAQIQQPLPIQGNPNQLQLVQGPDGQYVLQSAMQQPTILTQASLEGGTLSIPGAGGTPTIIGALPNATNLNISAPLSASLMAATSLAALPQQQQQHRTIFSTATPTLVNSSFINSRPIISAVSANNTTPLIVNNNTIVKTATPNRPRGGNQSNRVPLYEDDRLPLGWYRKVSQRKSGASAGRYEVFIVGPTGKRFRSRNELKSFFEQTGESALDPEDFDFSTFGSGRNLVAPAAATSNAIILKSNPGQPELISGAQLSASGTSTPAQSSQATMAASAATAITLPTSNNINNNSSSSSSLLSNRTKGSKPEQDSSPLPTLEPNNDLQAPPESTNSSDSKCAPSLLPSIQVPSRTTLEYPTSSTLTLSTTKPPIYSSQISRETEDADAQISQLLKTLQEEPHKLSIDPEFIQSLAGGDVDFDGALTPPPPQLAPAVSRVVAASSSSLPLRSLSKTTPPTPHQVPELNATTNLQMRLLGSTSDKTTSFKTFAPGGISPLTSINNALPQQQIIQVSRGELLSGGGGIVVNSSGGSGGLVPIGGVSTQVRALQNLPSNTRLVRGPNGQYTIQKVQTIELSPEMQQSLKEVQSRIQEIEKQMGKSPQDEAELAQLQTRQQRILSLGRPIPTPASSNAILGGGSSIIPASSVVAPSSSSSIGMINPGATISTSSIPPQVQEVKGSSGGGFLVNTDVIRPPEQQLMTASKSLPPPPPSGMITTPSGTNIPPLTETQKRIVAHFKQKMASLPPEQQATFIANNKASLIRRLNFQPSQIHILCSNRVSSQQQAAAAPPPAAPPPEPPAPPPLEPPPAINKHKKIAWVESQVKKDQNEAVHPNIKTPFRSKEDACKRLLRYHVFHELDPHPEKVIQEELAFSAKAGGILGKFNDMRDKYHFLLLQESMRLTTSSEEVMLARLWDSDERQILGRQKEDFEKRGVPLGRLPPVPSAWREKYIQVLGHPPPPSDDYDEFHSIQNELSRYNSINGNIGNTSGSSELFELPPQKIPEAVSDDDEADFGLKDVCGGNGGVESILGERPRDEELEDFGQKDVVVGDSVQSAINSILDDRIQTPDINNIAGLLDSFSDATSDPATESAVNSIPRF